MGKEWADVDAIQELTLFDTPQGKPISLADKFQFPPMTVLDRRQGEWRARRAAWLSLGMQSELGRDQGAYTTLTSAHREDWFAKTLRGEFENNTLGIQAAGGISVFDPVVCEYVYRWFCPDGGRILDPFAGGSVRGVVASHLNRSYVGVDISATQVAANYEQATICGPCPPQWVAADSYDYLTEALDEGGMHGSDRPDFLFSCPPYGDLEVYSDHPADISNMTYPTFLAMYRRIIGKACLLLKSNRFAAWVISDFRDRKGFYRNFAAATIEAFEAGGLRLYNDAVILDPVGSAALRAERQFRATRKMGRTHQQLLVFVKGDPKQATIDCGGGLVVHEYDDAGTRKAP